MRPKSESGFMGFLIWVESWMPGGFLGMILIPLVLIGAMILSLPPLWSTNSQEQPTSGATPTVNAMFVDSTAMPTMMPTVTLIPTSTPEPTSTRAPSPTSAPSATISVTSVPAQRPTSAVPAGPYIHLDYKPEQVVDEYAGYCEYDPNGDHQGELQGSIAPFMAPDYAPIYDGQLIMGTVTLRSTVTGWHETQQLVDATFRFACLGPETYQIEIHAQFRPNTSAQWIPFDNQNPWQGKPGMKELYQEVVVKENLTTTFSWIPYFGE